MHYHAEVYLKTLENMDDEIDKIFAPYDEQGSVPEYKVGVVSQEEKQRFIDFYNDKNSSNKKLTFDQLYLEYGEDWNNNDWRKTKEGKSEFPANCIHCGHKIFDSDRDCPKCGAPITKIITEDAWEEFSTYNKKSFWDWYQIGGRWTGVHDSFDPKNNPDNWELCDLCEGTGLRNDSVGKSTRIDDPSYTCNGCGEYSRESNKWGFGKYKKGWRLKWPTQFEKYKGDIISLKNLKDDFSCYTLAVNKDTIFHTEEWDGKTFTKTNFDGNVKNKLKELGIEDGYLITIDYHC
jgi:hypothetical protein